MNAATAKSKNVDVRPTYFSSVSHGRRAVDLAVLGILFVIALLGFQTVYGGIQYVLTGVMALVLATLVALIAARFRWGPLRTVPVMLLVYFLFGSMFAAPTRALWGIVPTLGSLKELLFAPVATWKSTLTIAPPVGTAQGVLGVVWISMLLLALFSMTIVMRTRFYVIAWLFPLVLLLVSVVFGTNQATMPVVRGVLFAVVSVAWLTWRYESDRLDSARSTIISDTVRPGSWKNPVLRRRVIGGALIMALSAGAAIGAHSLLDPPTGTIRYAVRDRIPPPFDPRQYVSPLTEFRGYIKNQRSAELFTVTGVTGGEKVRLATMDQYNLQVYNVAGGQDKDSPSGAFLRTAGGVDLHEAGTDQRTSTITIGEYSGVWMPTLGERTNRIELGDLPADRSGALAENLYLNEMSQTAVNSTVLRSGDSYEVSYEPYTDLTAEQRRTARFADIPLAPNERLGPEFAQFAEERAGSSDSDYENFQYLSRAIKDGAYFTHGVDQETASLSGHGYHRMWLMLQEVGFDKDQADAAPMGRIGDEEQFAVLTALLARELDIPARVVMGFKVPEGAEGTVSITGENVTAWVEVAFEGYGWVRFDPAPEDDQDPMQPKPTEVEKPRPQVAQPPPPPAEPPSPPPGAMSEDIPEPEPEPEETSSWLVYTALALIPVLLLVATLVGIVVAKVVRRKRRRTRGVLPDRIDGGWQEILDLMADTGRRPDPIRTRSETAALLDAEVPGMGAALLAGRADRAVFGPDDLPQDVVDEYWAQVSDARRTMTASLPWRKRVRALFSLRSFRRHSAERRDEKRRLRAVAKERSQAERRALAMKRRRAPVGSSRGARSVKKKGRS